MISVAVTEASQVAEARRRAAAAAQGLGFDEPGVGRVALVATELATNIVKYGTPGEMLIAGYDDETGTGLQLIALDKGPGIGDVPQALRDGFSTGGSAGTGLGAVQRQAQTFELASWPGRGTVILARMEARLSAAKPMVPPSFAAVNVPLRGEAVSGDAYSVACNGGGWSIVLADGLGHGPQAAEASLQAVTLFDRYQGEPPGEILVAIHNGIRHTRGSAVSISRLAPGSGSVVFAGIGNVAGAVIAGEGTTRMVSLPGTAGHVARRIREFTHPFPPGALLVMHSDGIGTSWSLDRYPGLIGAHPGLIAAVLYRDFARGRDDAAVVVARAPAP